MIEIRSRSLQCWRETESNSGQDRNGQRETEHAYIERHFVCAGDAHGAEPVAQSAYGPESKDESERGAENRQEYTFGEQLLHDACAAGAQRGANRDFLLSGGRF